MAILAGLVLRFHVPIHEDIISLPTRKDCPLLLR